MATRQTNAIELTIRARNEARPAFEETGRALRDTTRYVQALGGEIATQFNPIAGEMIARMTNAARAASGLSLGMAGLVTVAAGVAVGFGKYLSVVRETTERSIEFQRTVASLNFQSVVSQADAAAKALETFDRSFTAMILDALRLIGAAPGTSGAPNLFDRLFGRTDLEEFRREIEAGFKTVL